MINLNNYYKLKYLKYKNKYISLQNQYGGDGAVPPPPPQPAKPNPKPPANLLGDITKPRHQLKKTETKLSKLDQEANERYEAYLKSESDKEQLKLSESPPAKPPQPTPAPAKQPQPTPAPASGKVKQEETVESIQINSGKVNPRNAKPLSKMPVNLCVPSHNGVHKDFAACRDAIKPK